MLFAPEADAAARTPKHRKYPERSLGAALRAKGESGGDIASSRAWAWCRAGQQVCLAKGNAANRSSEPINYTRNHPGNVIAVLQGGAVAAALEQAGDGGDRQYRKNDDQRQPGRDRK